MTTTAPSRPITDPAGLEALCARIAAAPHVAIDTEFIRDRTYFARLCLVQVATEGEHALIDPIALTDLTPLREALLSPGLVKVFHAGRSDLEIFHDAWGVVPSPVFDTQVAATVLGYGAQVGYARLVGEVLGVELDKAGTLTDWARRPLSDDQLRYAAADVVHLVPLYVKLRDLLIEQGRGDWVDAEMRSLAETESYRVDPNESWRQVRGAGGLKGAARAVLRELAAWRELAARERNQPKRWIVGDDALVEIAKRRPTDPKDVAQIRGINDAWLARHGAEVVEAVARGVAAGGESAPKAVRRTSGDSEAVADLMACLVRLRARERNVTAGQLATRDTLERLAEDGESADVPVLEGWRREMIGDDLLALRDGRLRLVVRDGAVMVEPA